MPRSSWGAISIAAALSFPACTPNSATQVLTDTAYDISTAERFGRMDIVFDQVAPGKRDAFVAAHEGWGSVIRIVDLEYGGMRMIDPAHADVSLTVAWQRPDEASLRSTTLKQTWFHASEHWVITGETRVAGDKGLLDEPDPRLDSKEAAAKPAPHSHRASTTIDEANARSSRSSDDGLTDPTFAPDTVGFPPEGR